MNLSDLAKGFSDEQSAVSFLESKLWPDGPVCPHCGLLDEAFRMESKPDSKHKMRPGMWKCSGCRKTFRVTVGTIFEDSHIPLNKWLMAIHLLCASKKGMSAHQLHRMLGVTYKSAWFMAHRIRYAMGHGESPEKLSGTIEADETYIGGKVKGKGCYYGRRNKIPVVTLVERNGNARSFLFENVTAKNLRPMIHQHIEKGAMLMTDDSGVYTRVKDHFASHDVVQHSAGEYTRYEPGKVVHTNTVEGFFSILKRGIIGTYHHVGKQHLGRYLSEFDFRYNSRKITDGERALQALKGFNGKRLTYRTRTCSQN